MSVLVAEPVSHAEGQPDAPRLFDAAAGGPTLEEVIAGAWEGLMAHASVECPVCHGEMTPQYAAGAGAVGGRCASCGTSLG